MKYLGVLFFLFSFTRLSAQEQKVAFDTLSYSFNYAGKNLAVKNSFDQTGPGFSVKEVWVNGEKQTCETNASAFIIDLSERKLDEYLKVQIVHSKNGKPIILGVKL